MHTTDVTLITCAKYPQLDPDDQLLSRALEKFDLKINTAIWSDFDFAWAASKLCLIRSTWDYALHLQDFLSRLREISKVTHLYNDFTLIEWNVDKRYLQKLSKNGVEVIPTWCLEIDEHVSVKNLVEQFGRDIVIKPTIGLGGEGVVRINLDEQTHDFAVSNIQHLQKIGCSDGSALRAGCCGCGRALSRLFRR